MDRIPAFNRVTHQWVDTVDGSDLQGPISDWIINPTFVPDKETCMRHGAEFWSYPGGNVIQTVSEQEYQTIMLQRMREIKWREIQAERDRRKANGVKVGNYWFHSDDSSRIQQIGLLLMGQNMPPNIMWKTMTGDFVQMTPQLAQQIFSATGAQDIQLFAVAEQKRQEMLALPTPCDYSATTGWPPTFGE